MKTLLSKRYARLITIVIIVLLSSFIYWQQSKPTLYIIGDSTVKNGSGAGSDGLWGWGSLIGNLFDTTRIHIENHAIGGRSSRTFITDGRWDRILSTLKAGDYVIMQFGHNDGGALDDTARARGTIKGTGNESKEIYNPIRKVNEVVYTYGYYMRKYVNEAKAKGAIPIICAPIPRNTFNDGKINRSENYALWSKEVADSTDAFFIPLHTLVCDQYDILGADSVNKFFPKDHTHPNLEGSTLNAGLVIKGIKDLKKCDLKKYTR